MKDPDNDLKGHPFLLSALKGIPQQLWSILLPTTRKGLAIFLGNIAKRKLDRIDRRKAYDLWSYHRDDLYLRDRKLSLRDIKIKINIIKEKKRMKDKWRSKDDGDI